MNVENEYALPRFFYYLSLSSLQLYWSPLEVIKYLWSSMQKDSLKFALAFYYQVANRRGVDKQGVQNFFSNSINGGILIDGGVSEIDL